ncbi:Oxidoreductase, molybdopterin binding protein [metagenome]|uniref:Oxidoreductase, molybdopterin binding protein n=1 Tax=metagenome TaxID=256318 RepID=A0A2P2BYS2_9ZZZZ
MRTRVLHALYGVVATITGMAAAHLLAALLDPNSSPVLAVGNQVIDLTPTPLKEWAVRHFGTNDKPILIGSVLIGTLILSGIAGLLARRRFALGAGLLILLVGLAGAAALNRPTSSFADVLPSVLAGVVGVAVLGGLCRLSRPAASPSSAGAAVDSAPGTTRRPLLIATGLAGLAAAMGGGGQWLIRLKARPEDVTIPAAADPAPAFPQGLETRIKGISSLRTPTDSFYRIDTSLITPTVSVDGWTLTIDGDVENQLEFTFDELAAMPLIERDITLTCVSNEVGGPYVGGARWLGVRLTDLLDQAGVGTKADQILSTAYDGFTISTPLEVATDGRDAMVAIAMNGEALPRAHGFPVRLITPGIYGFVGSTKWLTKLTLTTYADQQSYWTERDWATDAPIKVESRIDTPKGLSTIKPGMTAIGGVAWAQQRGIGKIEVRIDGGAWQEAKLGPEVNLDYWRQWYLPWEAKTGSHQLAVRATTQDGETQTAARVTVFPDGATGIQEIVVNVA